MHQTIWLWADGSTQPVVAHDAELAFSDCLEYHCLMKGKKSISKVYLTRAKVQALGRIALGPAAMRNLALEVGDEVDVYFDVEHQTLQVNRANSEEES